MAILFKDRVKDTSTDTGTGNFTIANSAPAGFQTFNTAYGTGSTNKFGYCIDGGIEWEVGIGYLSDSTTLVRAAILASNTGSEVSFTAGTKNVFTTLPGGLIDQRRVLEADFSKTNNTFSNVTDLTLNLLAGRWYRITGHFQATQGDDAIFCNFSLDGGTVTATGVLGSYQRMDDTGTGANTFTSLGSLGVNLGYDAFLLFDFTIQVNAGGTLIPQFAQGTTNAIASIFKKYSAIQAVDITP